MSGGWEGGTEIVGRLSDAGKKLYSLQLIVSVFFGLNKLQKTGAAWGLLEPPSSRALQVGGAGRRPKLMGF